VEAEPSGEDGRARYTVVMHPDVADRDLKPLNRDIQLRILNAMESRLSVAPEQYGVPLRRSLKGYRKLRVGDYRVVYRMAGDEVRVFGVGNRNNVYDWVLSRTGWAPD